MTIKQQGGIFGRNPTFNDLEVDGSLSVDGDLLFTDTSNDRIGINTNSPAVTLDVNGGSTTQLRLTAADSTSASIINFGDQANVAVGRIIYSHVTDSFSFKTNNVNNRLTIDSSGNVTVGNGNLVMGTSGSGIDFSATSGTGTSELFSDYEEGSFTPTYVTSGTDFDSVTYDTQEGYYTKVGNMVNARVYLRTDSITVGSASGTVRIGGLPFAAANSRNSAIVWATAFTGDHPHIAQASGSELVLYYQTTSNGSSNNALAIADLNTGANDNTVIISICYQSS
jgi:hypothetical protein